MDDKTREMRQYGDYSIQIDSVTDGGTVNINPSTSSFETAINQLKPVTASTSPNPMHYLNQDLGFYGREEECHWIDKFCQTNEQAQYMVVYGIGGVGKSKFMYEYIKQCNDPEWHMCFVTDNIITSLLSYPEYNYSKNLLLVFDYASRNSEIIGKWLSKLSTTNTTSNKVRIVLIERQGHVKDFIPWLEKFYGNSTQRRFLKQIEFDFLELKQLEKSDLSKLIGDYVSKNYPNKQLGTNDVDGIIQYASDGLGLVERCQSPLIVLLVSDAYVSGQNYRKWNLALIVQNYVEKLKENWLTALCDNDLVLHKSLIKVLVLATAIDGFNINKDVPKLYISDISRLTENQYLRDILENSTGFSNEIVHAIEPDIIGEYFVLNYLDKLATYKLKQEFIESFYSSPISFLDFMDRCVLDYAETGSFEHFFNNYISLVKPPIDVDPSSELYVILLSRYFPYCDSERKDECLKIVRQLHLEEVKNNLPHKIGITTIYAWLLVDFTAIKRYGFDENITPDYFAKAFKIAKNKLAELKQLSDNYSATYPSVLLAYSSALANFSNYVSEANAYDCVDKLNVIYLNNYKKNSDFAVSYARALNNYIMVLGGNLTETNFAKANDMIAALKNLYKVHISDAINLKHISLNIVNSVSDLDLREEIEKSKKAFYEWADMYQEEVIIEYAKGLNNFVGICTCMKKNEKAFFIFDILKSVYSKHCAEMPKVKIEYAKAIVNIIYLCNIDEAESMLMELKQFYHSEKKEQEIFAIRYINALNNHLVRAYEDNTYPADIERIFNEVYDVYIEYEDPSFSITKGYATCLYYVLILLILTRPSDEICDKVSDDLDVLYEQLYILYEKSDSHLKEIIGNYVESINQIFQ